MQLDGPRYRFRWPLLVLLLIFYAVAVVDRTAISMIVDPLRTHLGISDVQISLILGLAFSGTYATGGLLMGWAVDRAPRRWVMSAAMILWGLAEACCGLATSFASLFVARTAVGAGESALAPAAHAMIADAFPRESMVKAMTIYSLGLEVGIGLSLIAGGALVTYLTATGGMTLPVIGFTEPWRLVFIFTGIPTVILALTIFLLPEPPRGVRTVAQLAARPTIGVITFLRRNWQLWLTFFGSFGIMNIVNGAMLFWQPVFMSRYFHWRAADYGMALGLSAVVAGAAGMIFAGWMVQRMANRGCKDAPLRYYFWALVISTPLLIAAFTSGNAWIFLGLISLCKFTTFLGFAAAAVQLTTPPELRGRMSAIFVNIILSLVGTVVGPVVPAMITQYWLRDDTQIGLALAITVGICAPIALITIVWGAKYFRRAIDDAEALQAS